jgi:hypothetical protein
VLDVKKLASLEVGVRSNITNSVNIFHIRAVEHVCENGPIAILFDIC